MKHIILVALLSAFNAFAQETTPSVDPYVYATNKILAENGVAESQNILGEYYKTGNGVPQDYNIAKTWFQKAADQGFAAGQRNLGSLIVETNKDLGIEWITKAVNPGDTTAVKLLNSILHPTKPGFPEPLIDESYGINGIQPVLYQNQDDRIRIVKSQGEIFLIFYEAAKGKGWWTKASIKPYKNLPLVQVFSPIQTDGLNIKANSWLGIASVNRGDPAKETVTILNGDTTLTYPINFFNKTSLLDWENANKLPIPPKPPGKAYSLTLPPYFAKYLETRSVQYNQWPGVSRNGTSIPAEYTIEFDTPKGSHAKGWIYADNTIFVRNIFRKDGLETGWAGKWSYGLFSSPCITLNAWNNSAQGNDCVTSPGHTISDGTLNIVNGGTQWKQNWPFQPEEATRCFFPTKSIQDNIYIDENAAKTFTTLALIPEEKLTSWLHEQSLGRINKGTFKLKPVDAATYPYSGHPRFMEDLLLQQ